MAVPKKIVGPYLDSDVLNLSHPDPFPLDSLTLRHAKRIVGLDNVGDMLASKTGVQFRGRISIQKLDWLSELGKEWLQNGLNMPLQRAIEKSLLVVTIQGKLLSEPLYLRKDDRKSHSVPFKISSPYTLDGATKAKLYHVSSMEVLSYSKSRLFFSRWLALRTLEDLSEADKQRTPPEDRKEDWLVAAYRKLALARHTAKAKRSGTTFLHRRVHRAEVKNVFGRHAVWLKPYIKKGKLLSLVYWNSFILESKRRLSGIGSEDEEQDEIIPSSSSREPSREPDELQLPISNVEEASGPKPAWGEDGYGDTFNYLEEKPSYTAIDLLEVPLEPFQPPILSARLDWNCPFRSCSFHVDFLDLNDPVLNELPLNDKRFLFSKGWNSEDVAFTEIFYDVAERHYFGHLHKLGIELVGEHGSILEPGDIKEDEKGIQFKFKSRTPV